MTTQSSLDSWKGIVSNYLKAENLEGKDGSFVVEDVKVIERTQDDGSVRNQIEVDTIIDDVEWVFALNYTNAKVVKAAVATPKELIGKRLFWEKVKVQNPKTNKVVDGISIVKVE